VTRTNRRHTRAIERHRRNKGPALLSRVADKKIEDEAEKIITALFEAITARHNASAASLLVELAENAEYADNPAVLDRLRSLAELWSREPQVVALDVSPRLEAPPRQLQLSGGATGSEPGPVPAGESPGPSAISPGETLDAIYE